MLPLRVVMSDFRRNRVWRGEGRMVNGRWKVYGMPHMSRMCVCKWEGCELSRVLRQGTGTNVSTGNMNGVQLEPQAEGSTFVLHIT